MSTVIASVDAIASASASASAAASHSEQPASFKIIGLILAIASGFFIGASFVVKKKGLLRSLAKTGSVAGEGGHQYLKDWLWWTGMIMMIVGEICNLVAYSFTAAVLVTPLGALSVVICAILSHFILKETLTFFGWIGCFLCIVGSIIIALNAPEQQAVTEIRPFMHLFIAPGFLAWMVVMILLALAGVFYFEPRYGKRTMLVHIGICSVIGGLSVSCTQGLGASILTSIRGNNQVTFWFFWFLFVFVVVTLLIEINYLNKALELFNTAMVTPTYYVLFTFCTLVSSIVLYQGLKTTTVGIITIVLGFLTICAGITILQMSKVDPEKLEGLDRRSTILLRASRQPTHETEKEIAGMEDPGVDALRGGFGTVGSIIRARSRRASSLRSSINRGRGGSQGFDPNDPFSLTSVPRYQLSDGPTPAGNAYHEQLQSYNSLHPAAGDVDDPASLRSPTLRFDPIDHVHRVGRAGHPEEAVHSRQQHSSGPSFPPSSRSNSVVAHDYGTAPPPIKTIPEIDDYSLSPGQMPMRLPSMGSPSDSSFPASAPPTAGRFEHGPYSVSGDRYTTDDLGVRHGSDLGHSGHTLPTGGRGADRRPSRGHDRDSALSPVAASRSRENSTSHRDAYPHLSRKTEAKPEHREERRGLVGRSDDEESDDDDRRSAGSGEGVEDDLDDLFVGARAGSGAGNRASSPGGQARFGAT